MSVPFKYRSATVAWLHILQHLVAQRHNAVAPRGQRTVELLHNSVAYPIARPVVVAPTRKLSYKFMAAEAMWILAGDDRVETIAPYNPNIAQFSDDGVTFAGAYGPRIEEQISYVVRKLLDDRDTRQAVLTIWRPNPAASRDIPCTVSMTFNIRAGRLNAHVFMRSSDAWLGVPYDFFNFAMVAARVAWLYNFNLMNEEPRNPDVIEPGLVYWTAASSHLYERDLEDARHVLKTTPSVGADDVDPLPAELVTWRDGWKRLWQSLEICRDRPAGETPAWRIRPQ